MDSRRAELFSARPIDTASGGLKNPPMSAAVPGTAASRGPAPASAARQRLKTPADALVENMNFVEELDECMELEHVVGYTGQFKGTLQSKPMEADGNQFFVYSIGAVAVVQDLADPHNQRFLQGHDAEICSLDVSSTGKFLATAQLGSRTHPEAAAPVIVWSLESQSAIYVFEGLRNRVDNLSFSADARFLTASCGQTLCIWDIECGELILTKTFSSPISVLTWGAIIMAGRRPAYSLNVACASQVTTIDIAYDVRTVRYMMNPHPCLLPTSGLVRVFTCGVISDGHLLAGCSNGEICVFDLKNKVFRTSFPTGVANGVSVLHVVGDTLYVGGGDGSLVQMRGSGANFQPAQKTRLYGGVASVSVNTSNARRGVEVLVGTNAGMIYVFQAADLKSTQATVSEGHFHGITSIAFLQNIDPAIREAPQSDIFCSGSEDGSIYVWDLCDYRIRLRISEQARPTCLRFSLYGAEGQPKEPTIFSGWSDGKIRAYNARTGNLVFLIDNAHAGGVTSMDIAPFYLVSGGPDGKVRVWTWSQQLIVEFAEHKKAVSGVKADRTVAHLCHSCSTDGTVLSYDIRRGNRVATHNMARRGKFSCLEQRVDSEGELITASLSGYLHSWDVDYPDARIEHVDHPEELRCISLSRSGTLLAVAGSSGFVKVYHMPSTDQGKPELIAVGQGHFGPVKGLMWSPDERQIVSVSENASLCVWNFYGVP